MVSITICVYIYIYIYITHKSVYVYDYVAWQPYTVHFLQWLDAQYTRI